MRLLKAHRIYLALHEHFMYQWENSLPPFNLEFDPKAKQRFADTTSSMERDNYFENHTREECKTEWAKRYETLRCKL